VHLPTPLLSISIRPKTGAGRQNLDQALRKLTAEDPTISVRTGDDGLTIIAAVTELQLEIILDRLRREFNVEGLVGKLQLAYKEMLTRPANGEGRCVRKAEGQGQYGHVRIRLYPGGSGTGYVFQNQIIGDSIPKAIIQAVAEGIKEALARGVLAGYPIDDVRVELYDGSYHDVDSSEAAFKMAGRMAFRDAAKKAMPVLLEPIMRVDVVVRNEDTVDVIASLSRRHAQIQSQEQRGGSTNIRARAPLSELLGYGEDLRSRTRGGAAYWLKLEGYQPCRYGSDGSDDDRDAGVTAPRTPPLRGNDSAIALPEPDDTP
jgi:elongation factor G